jgi:hypothetical protein
VQDITDHKILKKQIVNLYNNYVQATGAAATGGKKMGGMGASMGGGGASAKSDVQREYNRQREYLEKSIDSLKRKLGKDNTVWRSVGVHCGGRWWGQVVGAGGSGCVAVQLCGRRVGGWCVGVAGSKVVAVSNAAFLSPPLPSPFSLLSPLPSSRQRPGDAP